MNVSPEFSRFADLVHRMRLAQQQYFRARVRTPALLMHSKELERQVDEGVTYIMRIRPTTDVQTTMFDQTPAAPSSAIANGK